MNRSLRTLGTIALSAAFACACAVALAWPSTTEADDFDLKADGIDVDTTRIGSVNVLAALVEDTSQRGKWVLEVRAQNTSKDSEAIAEVQEDLLKAVFRSEMSRAPSIPMVAWKANDKFELAPGETRIVRHALPAWLSGQIAAAKRPPKLDKNGIPTGSPSPSFSTRVVSKEEAAEAQQIQVASPQRKMKVRDNSPARQLPRAYSRL